MSTVIKQEKEIKASKLERQTEIHLFMHDIISYTENPTVYKKKSKSNKWIQKVCRVQKPSSEFIWRAECVAQW